MLKIKIILLILILSCNKLFALEPLVIDNINSDKEARILTEKTKFTKEDFVGHWSYFKYGARVYKDLSFLVNGTKFYDCKILDKKNNRFFMKCLSKSGYYGKQEKSVYARLELNYLRNNKNDKAYLNLGIRTNLNKKCFINNGYSVISRDEPFDKKNFSVNFKECGKVYPFDRSFNGEKVFDSEEEYKNYKKAIDSKINKGVK